ncbi:protein PLASTID TRANSCRIPTIONALLY ACTIVE 7-like isoform X1 [Cucurbita pepo subsp. pepo]|uniref:protein PLASTID TRANSCRIPTIONALLY ACTIVE 7-like isoform X1 n=1 Tax=Cucurbita pepo subsp. pepo TaxID=3664 RepID=UPI000C9D7AA0|nr:protein PLASTID TRANSCRIPTIONALLY ACTIVE 7-like isoform X1 [Cucurbita pepo subsp. pepo]
MTTIPSLSFASPLLQRIEVRVGISHGFNSPPRLQVAARKQGNGEGVGRRVWRRRKLTKKDEMSIFKMDRIPFLEEQVRKVKEQGKLITMDIERLLLSEDNRFDFVNEVAAEAKEYVENNRDEYGGSKKAILHVLSNRVNDAGFYRPDAYAEEDPFKPGPHYLKQEFT